MCFSASCLLASAHWGGEGVVEERLVGVRGLPSLGGWCSTPGVGSVDLGCVCWLRYRRFAEGG